MLWNGFRSMCYLGDLLFIENIVMRFQLEEWGVSLYELLEFLIVEECWMVYEIIMRPIIAVFDQLTC